MWYFLVSRCLAEGITDSLPLLDDLTDRPRPRLRAALLEWNYVGSRITRRCAPPGRHPVGIDRQRQRSGALPLERSRVPLGTVGFCTTADMERSRAKPGVARRRQPD